MRDYCMPEVGRFFFEDRVDLKVCSDDNDDCRHRRITRKNPQLSEHDFIVSYLTNTALSPKARLYWMFYKRA